MPNTGRSIAETIREAWERIARDNGHAPVDHFDLDEVVADHQKEERKRACTHLEPWVSLSAQGLVWLSHLHICLTDCVAESARHRTTWALTGFASAQGVAIRGLVLSGLDTAARTLLRTYIEALTVCIVCLHDEDLAERFVRAQDPQDAQQLWREELCGRRLRDRFSNAVGPREGQLEEAFFAFTKWFASENQDYSQSVHASYLGGVIASMPTDIETGEMRPGIIGLATGASVRTLESLAKSTWFFSRLMMPLILGKGAGTAQRLRNFKDSEHFDGIVITGFYVLGELITLYWDTSATANEPSLSGRGR